MKVTPEFNHFLLWEKSTHDTIDFKKIYVDMTGDILAGLMLSEIVFWHLPNKDGDPKMRVKRDGYLWIACARAEWWDRTRMSKRQADRALALLIGLKLIERKSFLFNRQRMTHIRLDQEVFVQLWNLQIADPLKNPYREIPLPSHESVTTPRNESVTTTSPIRDTHVTKSDTPITETTTETTTESQKTLLPFGKNRRKHPNEDLHHALVRAFGFEPERMTKTSDRQYWIVAAELRTIGLNAEHVPGLYHMVKEKARRDEWSKPFSVVALAKYAPDFLKSYTAKQEDAERRADAERIWRETHPDLYPVGASS